MFGNVSVHKQIFIQTANCHLKLKYFCKTELILHFLDNYKSANLKNIIELENMEFFGYHGCYREEQVVGNNFVVNLKLETSSMRAAETDQIADALNYQLAYQIVKREVEKPSHLLEHVCARILDGLFEELSLLEKATVKVSKLNPPMGGKMDRVSVTQSRER